MNIKFSTENESSKKLLIDCNFDIFKISDSVFKIGPIELSSFNDYYFNFINLLNKGPKFIPCSHFSKFQMYSDILYFFEKELLNLNFKVFLNKSKSKWCIFSSFNQILYPSLK